MVFWVLFTVLGIVFLSGMIVLINQVFNGEDQMISEAEEKLEQGETREAATLLQRVMDSNPTNIRARWQMGRLMEGMGQYGEAANHYEACLQENSYPSGVDRNEALERIATVYEKSNEMNKAIDAWSRYLEDNQEDREAYRKRGDLFMKNEQFDRAIGDFQTIRREFEEFDDQILVFIARCYGEQEQYNRALDYFDEYLEANPGNMEIRIEAAQTAREAGEYAKATEHYDFVRENGNQNARDKASIHLIELFMERGQLKRAQEYLHKLEGRDQQDELSTHMQNELAYWKGKILIEMGEEREGVSILRDLYDREPEFREVEELLENHVGRMGQEELMRKFMTVDRDEFAKMARRIVELMGYEPLNTDSVNPEEVSISARETADALKVNRALFGFKRWNNRVAEWPLKEFELEILEQRYDQGYFICPQGFTSEARNYVEHSNINLIGPDELLQYLREAQSQPQ